MPVIVAGALVIAYRVGFKTGHFKGEWHGYSVARAVYL